MNDLCKADPQTKLVCREQFRDGKELHCDTCVYGGGHPENSPEQHDPVNHPSHYTAGGIECIDAITAALDCQTDPVAAWLTGQVIKYLWRWPLKNGAEDLRKAAWYLNRLIGRVEQ